MYALPTSWECLNNSGIQLHPGDFLHFVATDTGLAVLIGPERFIHHHEEKIILYPMVHSILEYLVWSENADPISFIGFCPPLQSFLICKSGYPNFKESDWFLRWDIVTRNLAGRNCGALRDSTSQWCIIFLSESCFKQFFYRSAPDVFKLRASLMNELHSSIPFRPNPAIDLPWICDKAMRKPLRLLGDGQGFRLITKYHQSMSFAVNQTRTADKITVQPNSLVTMPQCKNVQPDSLKLE